MFGKLARLFWWMAGGDSGFVGHSVCGIPDIAGRVVATFAMAIPVTARARQGPRVAATVLVEVCED